MTILAFFCVLFAGGILSFVLERRRRAALRALTKSAHRALADTQSLDAEVNARFRRTLVLLGSALSRRRSSLESLIQIAETVVYTKQRIRTFYNPALSEVVLISDPPSYLATGAEIDPDELRTLLLRKAETSALEHEREEIAEATAYNRVIPFKQQAS